jgi:hypothetical protein
MKTRVWFGTTIVGFIVILALGVGLVQASPKMELDSYIQANARWLLDYVDTDGDVGSHVSIAFDPGTATPWISYYDEDNTALKVAHYLGNGGNCGPENKWYCETVDNAYDVGTYSSIDVYPNTGTFPINTRRVGVAYYDATHGALKFAEYSCFMMTCEWDIVTIQDASGVLAPNYGRYTSIKYNGNGEPLIAFYVSRVGDDDVDYAYQVDSGGNCGEGSAAGKWHCEKVDGGDQVGQFASLDYSPFAGARIAYYDGSAGDLKYAYFTGIGNCGDGNAWYCQTLDGTGADVGKFVSVHAPISSEDKLQFAYYDATSGKLKYAKKVTGGSGNCGPGNGYQCDFIDNMGTALSQAGLSLVVDSENLPIIAYMHDQGTWTNLKVAQQNASLGVLVGNCGPQPSLFYTWTCTEVDVGFSWEDEAEYVSIALNRNDAAMIAYSEYAFSPVPSPHSDYGLKIAYQRLMVFLPIVLNP